MKILKNDKIIVHVICLIIAIVFWALIMIGKNPLNSKYFYKVPVTIKDADVLKKGDIEYMLMENKDSFTVDVKVTGLNTDLSKLTAKDIKASATMLSNFNEGTNSLLVTVEAINDMKAEVISTRYIKCNIEQIVTVSVDVAVKSKGALTDGYIINRKYSNPDSIFVKGPRSIVNSVSKAEAVVDIDKKIDNISDFKPVMLKDNTDNEIIDTSKLTLSPSSVEVIYEILPTKEVPINVIVNGEPAEGYKLTELNPAFKTIKIAAPKQILSKITEIDTEPIDISNAESHVIVDQKLVIPNGVMLVKNTDKPTDKLNIIAVIEKLEEKEFVFDYADIEFINKSNNLIVVPPEIEGEDKKQIIVKIKAVESVLNQILKEHIKLSVDLTEAVEGANDVLLNVSFNLADVVIESISSDTEIIKLKLEKLEVVE